MNHTILHKPIWNYITICIPFIDIKFIIFEYLGSNEVGNIWESFGYSLPYSIEKENVSPVYTSLPGWKEDLTQLTKADQLPKTLNDYIHFLEEQLNVPIRIVSVGPDRKQTIMRWSEYGQVLKLS